MPRFICGDDSKGLLEFNQVDAETKLSQMKPHSGEFSVEGDRQFMEMLEQVASMIRMRVGRGGVCGAKLEFADREASV